MKACLVQELSGPSGLFYTDVEDPVADSQRVVIDVRAAGVCFPDLLLVKGEYQPGLPPPFVPGMEVAGVVRSAPTDSDLQVGERVSAFGMLGGYAEQVAVPVSNVMRSPAELDDAQAAALLVNYNTAYFALAHRAAMRPGDTVLVLGSAGGIGTAAIQIAKALGAGKVIAVVHRESGIDYVTALGPDVVLPLADGWTQQVAEHTGGQGVDIVVDPIGGHTFDDAIRVLAIGGRLLAIGLAAGDIASIKVKRLLLSNVGVLGVAWGEYLNKLPGSAGVFAWELSRLVRDGLKPPSPQRFPLSEGRAALQSLTDGDVLGKAVLLP